MPPCDLSAEMWTVTSLLVLGAADAMELMTSFHNVDPVTYLLILAVVALYTRHFRRHHRDEPIRVPEEELIK
jgi:hypothetical protein